MRRSTITEKVLYYRDKETQEQVITHLNLSLIKLRTLHNLGLLSSPHGICVLSERLIPEQYQEDARLVLSHLFTEWEDKYTSAYPVEGFYEWASSDDKWKHPKRLKLLDYLINETGNIQW